MRKIRALIYDGVEMLDVAGTLGVFALASEWAHLFELDTPCYAMELVSMAGGSVMTSAATALETKPAIVDDIDTLLIPGAHGLKVPKHDPAVLSWLKLQVGRTHRVGVIGTGALILARTGLLDGRRVTTHWAYADELTRDHPDVNVMADAVYLIDGPYWTSAGILAGIDLALAMVEADFGRQLADFVARRMVATSRRTMGEAQLSAQLLAQETEVGRIRKLMEWIAENPCADLSVSALAERAALSRASLHRHFKREAQLTPAEYVERVRVGEARRLLGRSDLALERVAMAAGFNSAISMRQAFMRSVGIGPAEYRKTLAGSGNSA